MFARPSLHIVVITSCLAISGGISCADDHHEHSTCTIVPLHAGICQVGKDHVLGADYRANERISFVIYAFLVKGKDGQTALVDLGPKSVAYCNQMFRTHGFFRDQGPNYPPSERFPDDIVQPHGNAIDQLARIGLQTSDIDHIVFTHLHADHHGMDDAKNGGAAESFPNAMLHVSERGWQDNLLSRNDDGEWNSYVDFAFSDFLQRQNELQKVRIQDNAQVFPGVRTMYLGGHSVCRQAVIVDTAIGSAVIASDEVYLYQLLEEGILPQIRTSEANYRTAVDRLVTMAVQDGAILIPLHDPIVWETYTRHKQNWLVELKSISDRVVNSYLGRK